MADTKTNTTKDTKTKPVTQAGLDKDRKVAAKTLGDQKQVEVTIPKYLIKRLGNNVPVGVNGAIIQVPVGKKVKIPEAMAEVLNESLANLKI